MNQEGKAPKKPPSFGGREVDLYKMYRAVAKRGGYAAVTEEKKWKDVVRVLQVGTGGKQQALHVQWGALVWPCQQLPGLTAAAHQLCSCCGNLHSLGDVGRLAPLAASKRQTPKNRIWTASTLLDYFVRSRAPNPIVASLMCCGRCVVCCCSCPTAATPRTACDRSTRSFCCPMKITSRTG
jgi:hypothetical protein